MGRINKTERMMHRWKLPHNGDTPLKDLGLTVLTAFYNDHERFDRMFRVWKGYPDEVKDAISISIVDDGSEEPLHEKINNEYAGEIDFSLKVYRIDENIKWNTPGAWNLGITQAPTEWVVNVASDCCFDSDNISRMLSLKPVDREIYKLYRKRITNDPNYPNLREDQPHSEVFLLQKSSFLEIGGFDEDFTGKHSGGYAIWEIYFTHKFVRMGFEYGLFDEIVMFEYLEDITGGNVRWKEGANEDIVRINRRLWRDKMNGKIPECDASKIIRFDWEKVIDIRRQQKWE